MPDEEALSDSTTVGADANVNKSQDNDLTAQQGSSPQGYERLADMMGEYPAGTILRQFGSLNVLNLLYYQAELTQLEADLCEATKLDRGSTDACRQLYFRCYQRLSRGEVDGGKLATEDMAQWNLVLKLRGILKEYNKAIIAHHTIRSMACPDKESLKLVQHWIASNGNNEHVVLCGEDHHVWWDKSLESDLVALYAREYEDPVSSWITKHALYWYHEISRILSGTWAASVAIYSRKPLLRIVTCLAIGIASLMPILSIVILNSMHSTNARLGVMALFTVMFCLLFGIFTGPKKTELLAASAAFAAVQVVFINGGNASQPQ